MFSIVAAGLWLRLFLLMSGTWSSIDVVMTCTTLDSNRYWVLAESLLAGKGFTRISEEGPVHLAVERVRRSIGTWPTSHAEGDFPEGFRTPGYPLYLSLFGGHRGLDMALLVQCIAGGLAAALAAWVALRLGLSPRSAYVVGALWALHPAMITTDVLVLTESLFHVVGLLALAVVLYRPSAAGYLLAGLLVGLDGLVRPLGLIYLVPTLILAWPPKRRWLCAGLCLAAAVTPSLLWAARNANAGYGFRVSTVSEINLYYYGAAYVLAEQAGKDWKQAWPENIETLTGRLLRTTAPGEDVQRRMRQEALAIYREHPVAVLTVAAKSQVKLFLDHSMDHLLGQYRIDFERSGLFSGLLDGNFTLKRLTMPQGASLAWMGLNFTITLLALIGLVRWLRFRRWRLFFGCLLPLMLFSLASFPVGLERFRVPMMLYLFVPAAGCFTPSTFAVRSPAAPRFHPPTP